MPERKVAPFGSWKSPITSDAIVAGVVSLGEIALDAGNIYWVEGRPAESGRRVIVRRDPEGGVEDVIPPGFNSRTRAHEYGGGDFLIKNGIVYFSNFGDQRLYRVEPGSDPLPLTPESACRFADGVLHPQLGSLFCVREDASESEREPVNTIVRIDLATGGTGEVVVSGDDFYSNPRVSADGGRLAWLSWNHPNMPWDAVELRVGELDSGGRVVSSVVVGGGIDESIFQPEWSPGGELYFVSDRGGWWNLHRWRDGRVEPLREMEAEFGRPQWLFRMSTYAFESDTRLVSAHTSEGRWRLATMDTDSLEFAPIDLPYTEIWNLTASAGRAVFCAGSPSRAAEIVSLDLESREHEVIRRSSGVDFGESYLSAPRPINFPTEEGLTAHAFFYQPNNQDFAPPEGERPPLIVISHGGPTSAASTTLNPGIQYWTSRGFGVLDVNYGGSTGYGREYRRRLEGRWGIVDVDDCVNGARYLVAQGLADPARLIIRGGSAGGYTTLCALTFRDVFRAGASYYGISDLEALEKEGHKFESRYNHSLLGPYPESAEIYRRRSPIHFTERLSCPLILFQGLEDRVVPPNQSRMMYDALRARGLPVAYIAFEGEQHGFRKAENIKLALDAELYFYSRVFGFEADVSLDQQTRDLVWSAG